MLKILVIFADIFNYFLMKNGFFYSIILILITSCASKVKETFLIPSGFEGRINVIFNQPNAKPIKVKEGRRIYEIPSDGILVTSSKLETGILDQEYFYIDNKGNKEIIEILKPGQKLTNKVSVFRHGIVGVYGNSEDKNSFEYLETTICNKNSIDSIYAFKAEKEFNLKVNEKTNRKF